MQLFFSAKVNFIDENSGRKFNMNFTRRVSSGRALGARAPPPTLLKMKGRQKRKGWQKEGRKEERKEERKEGRKEGRKQEGRKGEG